jgi:hypothetical protein
MQAKVLKSQIYTLILGIRNATVSAGALKFFNSNSLGEEHQNDIFYAIMMRAETISF